MDNFQNESWIAGKHSDNVEINTAYSTVSIGDFFAQGEDADQIIKEIHNIWMCNDVTPLEACEKWADIYSIGI